MNKKMRELLNAIEAKSKEVTPLLEGETKDLEKADGLLTEIEALQKEYGLVERAFSLEKDSVPTEAIEKAIEDNAAKDSIKAFADAARAHFKGMSVGSDTDGGYTVPVDIQTRIIERRSAKASLRDLVSVESVSTMSGARTFKKRSQQTGFSKIGEGKKIQLKDTPQFERIEYAIEKYGGGFPVTNELLADSDANITDAIVNWIGDESRITGNKLILEVVNTKTQEEIKGIVGIKEAVNVTLGQAFAPTSRIITNDDGLQYLDTLKDGLNRDLLKSSPTDPLQQVLQVGFRAVPLTILPNSDFPSDEGKVPFVIGDLIEGIRLFDRMMLSIVASKEASLGELNAFEEDLTLFRALEREDVVLFDEMAFVNGYLVPSDGDTIG